MKRLIAVMGAITVVVVAFACQASPTAPATAATTTAARSVDLSGTWSGTGSDNQGPETFSMTMTQTGTELAGRVVTRALNPDDGSCGSCHKNKVGTVSGTLSGSNMTLQMSFPAGSDAAPTPMCGVTLSITAPVPETDRIAGGYSGADSCEGPFSGGTLTMSRQPMSTR